MLISRWRTTRGSSARSRCIPIGAPSSGCCTTHWNKATASAFSPIPTATRAGTARAIRALASAPIESLEIRNGLDVLETWRPYDKAALGRRIRVIWEGSEYRGRGRQTIWDGGCTLSDNGFERVAPINLWNLDKKLSQ